MFFGPPRRKPPRLASCPNHYSAKMEVSWLMHSESLISLPLANKTETSVQQSLRIAMTIRQRVIGHHLSFGHIYATGDVTERHSIRIGGGAMVEGSVAAVNIYSSLMATRDIGFPLVLERCPQVYRLPRMALSIGKNIVCYQGENAPVETGQKLGELCFGQDLGWQSKIRPGPLNIHFSLTSQQRC